MTKISEEIIGYVRNHIEVPDKELARILKRKVSTIELAKAQIIHGEAAKDKRLKRELIRERPEWKQLKEEFTQTELTYIEYRHAEIVSQFKEDILSTEEFQILQLLRTEILTHRILADQKKIIGEVAAIEKEIQIEVEKTNPSDDVIRALESRLGMIHASKMNKTREYTDLCRQHSSYLEGLKATRQQRIKNIESNKKTFQDLLKAVEDEEFREKEGYEMMLYKESLRKEKEKLSLPHQYVDGQIDLPILNHETVVLYDANS